MRSKVIICISKDFRINYKISWDKMFQWTIHDSLQINNTLNFELLDIKFMLMIKLYKKRPRIVT